MAAKDNKTHNFDIRTLKVTIVKTSEIRPSKRSPRRKTREHVEEIARSVDEFGAVDPILADEAGEIIAGESTFDACIATGMNEVPVIFLDHLNESQKVALRIAHNRLCEKGSWDQEQLAASYEFLMESEYDFDLEVTGYEVGEIDILLEGGTETIAEKRLAAASTTEEVELSDLPKEPISRLGDVFRFGDQHVVVCGDATTGNAYRLALGNRKADLGLTDSPYNIAINKISGRGKTKHRDFIQGSGEMSSDEFRSFVESAAANMETFSRAGAYSLFFTAWYSLPYIMAGCDGVFGSLSHMCIWAKTNGGMGSPWRNAWEGILVYRKKGGRVQNNVQLGKFGRNRTDVFTYAGVNVFRPGRMEELRSHPTCKPVQLLKDVILDITPIGGIVLDPFLGSGSTIVAAHEARRCGVGIELDPAYVDVAIQRIEKTTGIEAIHASGKSFAELSEERAKRAA